MIRFQPKGLHYFLAALAALVLFHWHQLGAPLVQSSDAISTYIGYRMYAVADLLQGKLPVWAPLLAGGLPAPAGIGAFSLWNIPYLFFSYIWAETWVNILQFLSLFLAMAFYLRNAGSDFFHSVLFALALTISGPVLYFYGYSPVYNGFITAVVALLFLDLWDKKGKPLYLALFTAASALHFLDMSYGHSLAFLTLIGCDRLFAGWRREEWKSSFWAPLLLFCCAFLLACWNWLPLFESILVSGRTHYSYFETFRLPAISLLGSVLWGPAFTGKLMPGLYIFFGMPLLFLGIRFLARRDLSALERWQVLLPLLVVLGFLAPVFLFGAGYDPFRINFLAALLLCKVAAQEHERLLRRAEGNRLRSLYFAALLFVSAPPALAYVAPGINIFYVILAGLALFPLFWFGKGLHKRFGAPGLMLATTSLYLAIQTQYLAHTYMSRQFIQPIEELAAFLQQVRTTTNENSLAKGAPGKMAFWFNGNFFMRAGNFQNVGIASLLSNNQYISQDMRDAFIKAGLLEENPTQDFWRFIYPEMRLSTWATYADFGVEWLLAEEGLAKFVPPGWETALKLSFLDNKILLIQNPEYVGTAYSLSPSGARQSIQPLFRDNTNIKFHGNFSGQIVVADNDYPGWRAFVDGNPAPLLRHRGILKAVDLPAGEHTVEFAYTPRWKSWAIFLFLFGALAAAFLLWFFRRKNPWYRIVNLKEHPEWVASYVELRNRFAEALVTKPVTAEETKRWMAAENVDVWVAASKTRVVAAAVLFGQRGGEVAIFNSMPHSNIASQLLQALEQKARESQKLVWAWTYQFNARAGEFFERNGYKDLGLQEKAAGSQTLLGHRWEKHFA